MTAQLWWHLYGGELPDLTQMPDGTLAPGWAQVTMSEATVPPEKVREKLPSMRTGLSDVEIPYLASFDHEPTVDEIAEFVPDEYREDDE